MSAHEEWRPVVGHEGAYEVSNFGRVRSLDRVITFAGLNALTGRYGERKKTIRGCILRPGRQGPGHFTVAIGKGNSRLVHHLVLEAFVGPRPEGAEGRHLNDEPSDNRVDNLLWGTRSENLIDAVRNGRRGGERCRWAKLSREQADDIRRRTSWPRGSVVALARSFGVSESTIRQVRDGRAWGPR